MNKRILGGGLLAVGLMAVTSGTASAQFVTPFGTPAPFGGSYGAAYQTPSGGFVQKQAYSNPFTGASNYQRSYANPFTGASNYQQSYSNPFTGAYYQQSYRNAGYNYNLGLGNAFNNRPYLVSPSYGPWGQTFRYSPLPFYR